MDDKKVGSSCAADANQTLQSLNTSDGSAHNTSMSGNSKRNGPQGLRSPVVKRLISAPVDIQGWLHKQGSEGLMLWKKRWFVLSQYCLFYYKGPEEEKLLGSILLPSYHVTACKPEDKVNRKFSFKAEHANMRTYHFAADSQANMNQWVNALTLASLLQNPNSEASEARMIGSLNENRYEMSGGFSPPNLNNSVSCMNHSVNNEKVDDKYGVNVNSEERLEEPLYKSFSTNASRISPLNQINQMCTVQTESNHLMPCYRVSQLCEQNQQKSQAPSPAPAPSPPPPPPVHMHQITVCPQSQYNCSNRNYSPIFVDNRNQNNQKISNCHHLYVNAPPKPKRLTDASIYDDYSKFIQDGYSNINSSNVIQQPCNNVQDNAIYSAQIIPQSTNVLKEDGSNFTYQPTERRTPDTYGRNTVQDVPRSNKDYEDIYYGYTSYQKPVKYADCRNSSFIPNTTTTPMCNESHYGTSNSSTCKKSSSIDHEKNLNSPPRPHSADFLDYDVEKNLRHNKDNILSVQSQPQRPKSSLDITENKTNNNDGFFYSEERYAAQMRQSSVFFHQTPQYHQNQRNQSLSYTSTPIRSKTKDFSDYEQSSNSLCLHSSKDELLMNDKMKRTIREENDNVQLFLNRNGSPSRFLPCENEVSSITNNEDFESCMNYSTYSSNKNWNDRQFMRSASARLPKNRNSNTDHVFDSSSGSEKNSRDRERRIQQREESMKRLLEWKQRMLQSPLTRKPCGTSNKNKTDQDLSTCYKRQALLDLVAHEASIEAQYKQLDDYHVEKENLDESRQSIPYINRYSSYSSDGEGEGVHSLEMQKNYESPSFCSKMNTIPRSSNSELKMKKNSDLAHMSAGELLGRTHEELVLLLIQLRRQNASTCQAIERFHMEIEAQARLVQLDVPRRLENLQKLEELRKNLHHLEKEYEKSKPLVNLVDNMVKLGSLYNRNDTTNRFYQPKINTIENQRDRIEFNQWIQEQKLLAEEKKDWKRFNSDYSQLQYKVQQLYKLDQLLQEESAVLQNLQHDKKILEKALVDLRYKLHSGQIDSIDLEKYKKQQTILEKELSRIRILLAHNSKKLEETVAENARLEQELIILKQKFQTTHKYSGNIAKDPSNITTNLEIELRRVQNLVGNLQKQREELSNQVRQLTEKSQSLIEQMKSKEPTKLERTPQINHTKKRNDSTWLETDLDSGKAFNHGLSSNSSSFMSLNNLKINSYLPQQANCQQYEDLSSSACSSIPSPQQLKTNNSNSMYNIHSNTNMMRHNQSSPVLSTELREQIQQHQLKQQLLKDQMQGKSNTSANVHHHRINPDCESYRNYINLENNIYQSQCEYNRPLSPPPPPSPPSPSPPPPSHILNREVLINNASTLSLNENYKYNNGLMLNREKPEIKTVRIVKRESERRQKDRNGISFMNGFPHLDETKQFNEKEVEYAKINKITSNKTNRNHSTSNNLQANRSAEFSRDNTDRNLKSPVRNGFFSLQSNEDFAISKNKQFYHPKIKIDNGEESSESIQSRSPVSSPQVLKSSSNYSTSPSNSPNNQIHPMLYENFINSENSFDYCNLDKRNLKNVCASVKSNNSINSEENPELLSPRSISSQSKAKSDSKISNSSQSPQLSPIFKSEAAKEIIKEMSVEKPDGPKKRFIPKRKRRHHTVSSSKPLLDLDDIYHKTEKSRARDDIDMERALKPGLNTPDVVRSTLDHKELKYNEMTIDQLFGAPNKIIIPERYIPEQAPELSMEEKKQRSVKVAAIRKMLSETTITPTDDKVLDDFIDCQKSNSLKKKAAEERKQRDHILQLNQILAKQVMEKSKMVAVRALVTLPLQLANTTLDADDLSPVIPLPLYQQRENFYS